MHKKIIEMLEKRQAVLEEKREKLVARSQESEDVSEVKEINDSLVEISNELHDIADQIAELIKEEPNPDEERSFNPVATYGAAVEKRDEKAGTTNSMEYRNAFMNMVLRNEPISKEVRANANTLTTDANGAIPAVLIDRIVEKMMDCGMILPLVTRTSYKAGVVVPTSSVRPVATWVAEGASSDRQKKTVGKVVFSYFKLRCEISMSMEVGTMAISAFETSFVDQVSKAMVIAIETAIIAGTGSGQPTGILTATPAATKQFAAAVPKYKELLEVEAAVPTEYEATAKWCMTKAQFMNFLAMVDNNGQPIARVNYGISGKPERTILGRDVVIVPYAEAMGSNLAFIYDFNDYVLNTIYDMGITKKQDWDTEDLLTKAVMSVDGKPVSAESLVLVTL